MKPTKPFGDKGVLDPETDERLTSGSLLPPQWRLGSLDGTQTDTCCAAAAGLGSRIRGFREFYDMSRGSLATLLNVSEETVAAWEDGQESPTVLQVCLMCEVFNTTPNALLLGPSYVQAGPLLGLGHYMESLPNEAQMAILHIARMCRRTEGEKSPA
jgi:DNA-binding transcriptional regulator YiaG